MAVSRDGVGNIEDEAGASCNDRSKEAIIKMHKDAVCQRDTGAILKSSQWPKLDQLEEQNRVTWS